jgi:hypothetical protein
MAPQWDVAQPVAEGTTTTDHATLFGAVKGTTSTNNATLFGGAGGGGGEIRL